MKTSLLPFLAAAGLSLVPASAQKTPEEDPRDQATNYFEDDKAREATATLAAAAAKNPTDRLLGAMLYAAVRDHVWHAVQAPAEKLDGAISAMTFSDDGHQVAGGSAGGEVVVIAVAVGGVDSAAKRLPLKHEGGVVGLAFSKDGRRLAVASRTGPMRIWDLAEGKAVYESEPRPAEVVAFDNGGPSDLVATGTVDGKIQVTDLAANKALPAIAVPGGQITTLAFTRSGEKIAAGCLDKRARVWNARTGKDAGAGIAHKGTIRSIDFSYDDRYVLSGGDDADAWLSNPDEGIAVMPAMHCESKIKKVITSYGGSMFATLLEDGSVLFWDPFTGKQLPTILREDAKINDFAWGYSGLRAATVSEDGHATIWTMRSGTRRGEDIPHGAPVLMATTSPPDSRFLATGTADGKVRVFRTDGGTPLPTVRSHAARARTAFYSRDGKHLVTASEDRTALHWISGKLRPFGAALKHDGTVTCAVFDRADAHILTADETGKVQLWEAATGAPMGDPYKHSGPVRWVDFYLDGKRFVSVSGPNAYVWSVDDRSKPLAKLSHRGEEGADLNSARFSADGKWLATGSASGKVQIWDANTYAPVGEPIDRGFPVLCVRFSPDGNRLVVTGEDSQAAVYEAPTWKQIGTPILTTGPVFSAAFTDDGKFLVIASLLLDTMRFYEIESGRPLGVGVEVGAQALTVDHHMVDRVVVVACDDGTVRAFETPFVNQDVPAWFPPLVELAIGMRKTGPETFEPIERSLAQMRALIPASVADDPGDFAKLVRWKFDVTNKRHGMPRFVSTLEEVIEQRVEERSVDALFECYDAISVDPLVLAALSLYLPNPRQSEYIADLSLKIPNTTPLSRCFAAGTLINAGRSKEAEAIAHQALAEAPNDVRVLRRVAKLEGRFSNKTKAIELFEKALTLEPDNAETHRAYGWALYNFQQPIEAAAQFRLAEKFAGETVEDLIAGLCLCAAAQKNANETRAAFARLVELDPAWKEAGHIAELRGWTQHELAALEEVRRTAFPNP